MHSLSLVAPMKPAEFSSSLLVLFFFWCFLSKQSTACIYINKQDSENVLFSMKMEDLFFPLFFLSLLYPNISTHGHPHTAADIHRYISPSLYVSRYIYTYNDDLLMQPMVRAKDDTKFVSFLLFFDSFFDSFIHSLFVCLFTFREMNKAEFERTSRDYPVAARKKIQANDRLQY